MSWDPTPTRRHGPVPAALRGPAITARDQDFIAEHRAQQSSSSGNRGQASSTLQRKRIQCPFPSCSRFFTETGDLKKHKIAEHDYCKICDLDFEDDDAFHLHKMRSEKHITCPLCSVDFQSESGRNRHFRQMHIMQQNIKCRGCHEIFPRGGGLMMHLEKNACSANGFNNPTLQANRAMMEIHMENVTNLIREDTESGEPSLGMSAADDTAGGGVVLDPYDILSEGNEEENQSRLNSAHPTLAAEGAQGDSDSDGESFTTETGALSETNAPSSIWPLLRKKERKIGEDGITRKLENLKLEQPAWNMKLFPNAPMTPATGYAPPSPSDKREVFNVASRHLNNFPVLDLKIDALDNLYHCPFPKCGAVHAERKRVEDHIASGTHRASKEQCPACLRVFGSAAALVQHMESASERCNIKESRHFSNAMTIVSGGYLTVTGYHPDGTIKLEDPEVQW